MPKPFFRLPVVLAAVVVLALAAAALPVFSGGWAVVTLDQIPEQVVAGDPITVGFVVRQHGVSALDGLRPSVRLQKEGDTVQTLVAASADGETGHYTATLTFPSAGVWQWSVATDFWPEYQPMPELTVLSEKGSAPAPAAGPSSAWPLALGAAGLVGVVGGGLTLMRTRAPWAAALTLAAALIAGIGFASASTKATALAPVAAGPTYSPAEQGQRLFVAKGCVVCHTHESLSEVKRVIGFSFDDAPNLTDYSATDDYLAKWLDDPESVKPNTFMPKLNLSDEEIGALIAFINTP